MVSENVLIIYFKKLRQCQRSLNGAVQLFLDQKYDFFFESFSFVKYGVKVVHLHCKYF